MNNSVEELFRNAEDNIRKDLPNFDTHKLISANMNVFHRNPAHQRAMLDKLTGSYTSELIIGSSTMKMAANPVQDVDDKCIGSAVEWQDRAQKVAVEDEVQSIVRAFLDGDLSQRIVLDGKEGFFETLGEGINELVDVNDRVISDTVRTVSAMAEESLTETIEDDYEGVFEKLKQDANATVTKLAEVIGEIQVPWTRYRQG